MNYPVLMKGRYILLKKCFRYFIKRSVRDFLFPDEIQTSKLLTYERNEGLKRIKKDTLVYQKEKYSTV